MQGVYFVTFTLIQKKFAHAKLFYFKDEKKERHQNNLIRFCSFIFQLLLFQIASNFQELFLSMRFLTDFYKKQINAKKRKCLYSQKNSYINASCILYTCFTFVTMEDHFILLLFQK